uniref:Conotoxin reg3c n=1 Tax=Conus regius TaxID=101314 RepID=CM3C_CONRE|nr:RecName: Full=Conotoxin reg3c [Conus regius]
CCAFPQWCGAGCIVPCC